MLRTEICEDKVWSFRVDRWRCSEFWSPAMHIVDTKKNLTSTYILYPFIAWILIFQRSESGDSGGEEGEVSIEKRKKK